MDDTFAWDLQRPDLLLRHLARDPGFDRPSTYLVRVDNHPDSQEVVSWTQLWSEPPLQSYPDRTEAAERALLRLGTPGFEVPYRERPLIVPLVVRPGTPAWTLDETEVMLALRYAGNTCAFMHEGPIIVTGSGWWMPFAKIGGRDFRARWNPDALLAG